MLQTKWQEPDECLEECQWGQAEEERGERGARIGDLAYSDKYLELGMLKGNHFAITLR